MMLLGALPTWPHSRKWGYYPSSGIGLLAVIVLSFFWCADFERARRRGDETETIDTATITIPLNNQDHHSQ